MKKVKIWINGMYYKTVVAGSEALALQEWVAENPGDSDFSLEMELIEVEDAEGE